MNNLKTEEKEMKVQDQPVAQDETKTAQKVFSVKRMILIVAVLGLLSFLPSFGIYKMAYAGSLVDGGVHACQSPVEIMDFFILWFVLWGFFTVIHMIRKAVGHFVKCL